MDLTMTPSMKKLICFAAVCSGFVLLVCVCWQIGSPFLGSDPKVERRPGTGVFEKPLVDNSQIERRILLVEQTAGASNELSGWSILCKPPRGDAHDWEVRLMSAQKFSLGKRNGLSIFFNEQGTKILMAGLWKDNAPWEGDFFLQHRRKSLICDGYFEELHDHLMPKAAARFVGGKIKGYSGKELGCYSPLFMKKLEDAVLEINQLVADVKGTSNTRVIEVEPIVRALFPAEKREERVVLSDPNTEWSWDSLEKMYRLKVLDERKESTGLRHGWVLMQFLNRDSSSLPLLMSAQHFDNGKLNGFSFFFNRSGTIGSIGEWKNGQPFSGYFPLRKSSKPTKILVTDGFWQGKHDVGLNFPDLFAPYFAKYENGSFVEVTRLGPDEETCYSQYPESRKSLEEALSKFKVLNDSAGKTGKKPPQ